MTSAIAIIYGITLMQNRIREANSFGPAHGDERHTRPVTLTEKHGRRLGVRTPAVGASRA
jgi:hypothetical protein